ncbi:MAG: DUF5985 family protein [Bacteriovoracia bacterium]
MIGEIVYVMCGLTSVICALLLYRQFSRSRVKLLLWCSLCFAGFAINNILLLADAMLVPDMDLSVWRTLPAFGGLILLIYGFVWDTA